MLPSYKYLSTGFDLFPYSARLSQVEHIYTYLIFKFSENRKIIFKNAKGKAKEGLVNISSEFISYPNSWCL